MDRPGFRKLVKDMETGQWIPWSCGGWTRLGRTAKGLTSLFEDLIRWKVNLISLESGFDLVTPADPAAYPRQHRADS